MPTVHPSAVVDPRAQVAEGAVIGPFCHVGPGVSIGSGTELVGYVTILGNSRIGANNRIFPHAVIGSIPQDLKYLGGDTACVIGDGNTIREGVTINTGTEEAGGRTEIGDHNLLMAYSHVAHDCILGNNVILANGVLLGGHILVDDHAVLGGNAALQHYSSVGTGAFVGGMSRVVHDAPPYLITEGNPARPRGVNQVKLERMGLPKDHIEELWLCYRELYRSGAFRRALEDWEQRDTTSEVKHLCAFLRESLEGKRGRSRELLRPQLQQETVGSGEPDPVA
ncbi:MAG: acyl-ACP--UDP-N-acetylglucosamine O-acyltransferase [Planctomycetota bacterium]